MFAANPDNEIIKFMQLTQKGCFRCDVRPRGYKTSLFKLNSAEPENFTANKYENANNSWHFHIYKHRNLLAQLWLRSKKKMQLLNNLRFTCWTNFMLCGVELEKSALKPRGQFA